MSNMPNHQHQVNGIIYRDYFKPRLGLEGKTPAEASGVKIEGQNKWKTLIQNAVKK